MFLNFLQIYQLSFDIEGWAYNRMAQKVSSAFLQMEPIWHPQNTLIVFAVLEQLIDVKISTNNSIIHHFKCFPLFDVKIYISVARKELNQYAVLAQISD